MLVYLCNLVSLFSFKHIKSRTMHQHTLLQTLLWFCLFCCHYLMLWFYIFDTKILALLWYLWTIFGHFFSTLLLFASQTSLCIYVFFSCWNIFSNSFSDGLQVVSFLSFKSEMFLFCHNSPARICKYLFPGDSHTLSALSIAILLSFGISVA